MLEQDSYQNGLDLIAVLAESSRVSQRRLEAAVAEMRMRFADNAEALKALTFVVHGNDHFEEACSVERQKSAINPQYPLLHHDAAHASSRVPLPLQSAGLSSPSDGAASFHGAEPPATHAAPTGFPNVPGLSRSPSDNIQIWYREAEDARQAGDIATAQAAVERILQQDPRRAGALYLRGLLALDSKQPEAAQSWVERAIEVHPHPDFYITLCVIQIELDAYASALQTARHGLALQPDSIRLRFYEAGTLVAQGFLDDAAVSYRKLLALEPDHLQVLTNLGVVAQGLDALEEAERHLRRAIALAPNSLSARAHLSLVLLATGRYEEGWHWYEDRWANFVTADGHPSQAARPQVPLRQWRGERPESAIGAEHVRPRRGPLLGRLLVIPEQGHGDSLQFVRYLPLTLERFSQVGYICPPSLRRLYEESLCSRWPGLVMLDDVRSGLDHWDWYCPMMSLPMAFDTRLDNVPAAIPYLFADPARTASWRAKLAALPDPGLPRVGVVWAGGHSGMMEDKVRSLLPAQLAPLLALPGIRWISLQKTDNPAKRADAAIEARLTDWMDEVTDFADTAALIENLDLVIAVDTSVAHLAAAMGKPVWLLNRFAGCWRWLRDRDDSPWYPTVRLFNQRHRGNWDEVLTRVVTALEQRFMQQDGRPVGPGSPRSEI